MQHWNFMKPINIMVFFAILFFVTQVAQVYAYTYSGTITENGDQYWDKGEYKFYKYELKDGETLELSARSSGNLEVMLCVCSKPQDIENILSDLVNYGSSSDLKMWIDTYGSTSGSYTVSKDVTYHVAIFTYSSTNPSSMSYTLESNLPSGSRSSGSGSIIGIIIVLAIIGFVIYKIRSKPKNTGQPSWAGPNYNQSYNPMSNQNRNQAPNQIQPSYSSTHLATEPSVYDTKPSYQSSPSYHSANQGIRSTSAGEKVSSTAKFCPNCGAANSGVFCTQCGTHI